MDTFQQQIPKGKKQKPSWFDRELQNVNGNEEVLIASMDYNKMYRDAPRIFKDLMHRNINLAIYGKYFINNSPLMIALYDHAYEKYCRYSTIYNALVTYNESWAKAQPDSYDILNYQATLIQNYQRLSAAYAIICQVLYNVKKTNDPSYLFSLSDKLSQYRMELQNE